MTFYRLLSAVLLPICWVFVAVVGEVVNPVTEAQIPAVTNSSTGGNSTHSGGKKHRGGGLFNGLDSSMIQRALYVLIGITIIGVIYFVIRAVR